MTPDFEAAARRPVELGDDNSYPYVRELLAEIDRLRTPPPNEVWKELNKRASLAGFQDGGLIEQIAADYNRMRDAALACEQSKILGRFCIPGAIRTKKNHGRDLLRGKRIVRVPSAAFEAWNKEAQYHLMLARNTLNLREPITCDVNCRALIYREKNVGDAVGFYESIADALQEGRIVANDRQIVSWDGSRLLVDKHGPRVEITLSRVV